MADDSTRQAINDLADEEHALLQKESDGTATDEERDRIKQIEIELDRCWDLLRQRRARRNAGQDPDKATVREESVVENYQQ